MVLFFMIYDGIMMYCGEKGQINMTAMPYTEAIVWESRRE